LLFPKRTRIIGILSSFQFIRHFIESVFVKTKAFVGSNPNVILTRPTCGQNASMSAGSKRRALAFYFFIRNCYMFLISNCRGEPELRLCTTCVLAKRMLLRGGDFRLKKCLAAKFVEICLPMYRGIPFASTQVVHRPGSDSPLHSDMWNILQIRTQK